jgi:HAD superfamily hydrolase (TIGR01509 family)
MRFVEGLMKSVEGIIFDMDGTLFDTERVSINIWEKVLEEYGYGMIKNEFITLIGRRRDETDKILMKWYGSNFPIKEIRDKKDADMLKYLQENGVPVKSGAFELLDYLVQNGYKVALATSSCRENVVRLLDNVGIREKFNVILCGNDVVNSKPNPEIFITAAEKMNVNPKKCVVLEDSLVGLQAACNAGMKCINIPDLREADDETKQLANKICKNLLEVREHFVNYV